MSGFAIPVVSFLIKVKLHEFLFGCFLNGFGAANRLPGDLAMKSTTIARLRKSFLGLCWLQVYIFVIIKTR